MKPTPAQIEAAAKAIFDHMSDIDGDEADWIHFSEDCMEQAEAALTAAAEVGMRDPKIKYDNDGYPDMPTRKDLGWNIGDSITDNFVKKVEAATIKRERERCAQVAEAQVTPTPNWHRHIAAAIRAMKDKA